MAHIRQEDIRLLEQARQRLYQLTQSIGSLKADVMRTSPLPAWDSLQISASILAQNLKSITDHLKLNSELFDKAVVYPSTNFPGRTQEALLGQLLRKKLEPRVERWADEGWSIASSSEGTPNGMQDSDGLEDTWQAAKGFIGQRIARAAVTHRSDAYTAEEREQGIENINTGLVKPIKLAGVDEESESDEDEDGDEKMEDVDVAMAGSGQALGLGEERTKGGTVSKQNQEPPRTLDEIARFMVIGMTAQEQQPTGAMSFRR